MQGKYLQVYQMALLSVEDEQDPANWCIGSPLNIKSTVITPMGSTVGHVAQHCLLKQMINTNTNKQQTTAKQQNDASQFQ